MATPTRHVRSGFLIICSLSIASLAATTYGQATRPDETTAEIAGERSYVRLQIIPEFQELAPFQPLYVKVTLANAAKRDLRIPEQIRREGLRYWIREEGYPQRTFRRGDRCIDEAAVIPAGKSIAAFTSLSRDHNPPHPRRSPLRTFDLPARYELRALSGDFDVPYRTEFMSDSVTIRVREPSADEVVAGDILKNLKDGPPFDFGGKGDPELVKSLKEFLAKYPKSVFADDFKVLLGWRTLDLATKLTETGFENNPELQAEAFKIWMTVDVKRTWVRRTLVDERLMRHLCKPEIQAHLNVREILDQWKVHPPHDKDDLEIAARLKLWVPFIEATLRGEQVTLPDLPE